MDERTSARTGRLHAPGATFPYEVRGVPSRAARHRLNGAAAPVLCARSTGLIP